MTPTLASTAFLNWAQAVLAQAQSGEQPEVWDSTALEDRTQWVPHASDDEATEEPWEEWPAAFQPAAYIPTEEGLFVAVRDFIVHTFRADLVDASNFSARILESGANLEQYENWVVEPLHPKNLQDLHSMLHIQLSAVAGANGWDVQAGTWPPEERAAMDRIFLAVLYILSWQHYRACVQFLITMAPAWYQRMSELVAESMENEALRMLWSSLNCVQKRALHFHGMTHGFVEGVGVYPDEFDLAGGAEDDDIQRLMQKFLHDREQA